MFRDIFKNRRFIGVLAFFVLCVVGSLLYMHHEKQKGNERQKPAIHREAPVEGDTSQVVDIPDPSLRAAIAEALHKAPGDAITRAEMQTLRELQALGGMFGELEAQDREITDLRGIEFAINLTELRLWFNNITDISPVVSLTNLKTLSLHGNAISDISPLANRTAPLLTLELNQNKISDISPLANLTNLGMLFLGGNAISDISPLAGLTNLGYLSLSGNTISDISPLANLTNLVSLDLQHNTISDISPLANLTNPWILDLRHNAISDIETLDRLMEQGTVVYFSGNPAFQTPGPQIEDGWVWLILPAANNIIQDMARSRRDFFVRDFLKEVSGGAVTEADVAVNGATAGTQVENSVWTPAPLTAADRDNLNAIVSGYNLETDIDDPLVVYGVVSIKSKTSQQTRVYISGGRVQVWFNATLVYRNTGLMMGIDYVTALPVQLNAGDNLLFIAAYRDTVNSQWGASFGFQDSTVYTTQNP